MNKGVMSCKLWYNIKNADLTFYKLKSNPSGSAFAGSLALYISLNKVEQAMNIQQLKCAIAVWKCGSISKAAERLYMNQPNLSRIIKNLEDEFNIVLFLRTAAGVDITADGGVFLLEAERVVECTEKFERSFKNGISDQLSFKIAVPRVSYLANAFSAALAAYVDPGALNITYRETNNQEAIDCVSSMGYDMGIIRFPIEFESTYKKQLAEKQLKFQEVLTFRFVVVMSRSHPLAEKNRVHFSELSQYTALVHGDNYSINFPDKETDALYKTQLYNNSITLFERGSQFDFLRNVPGTFMLVSPLPEDIIKANDLVQLRLYEDEIGLFEDLMISRRNGTSSDFERDFLHCLLSADQSIMKWSKDVSDLT